MTWIARICLQLLAALPLPWLHRLAGVFGRLLLLTSPRFRLRTRENLETSKIAGSYQLLDKLVKQSAIETAKGATELAIAWCRQPDYINSLVVECQGWPHVEAALQRGDGLIFVTPHLGSYDIAGRYIASRLPVGLTAMYRPPKLGWLEPVMNEGRARGGANTAPATGAGVRVLMKALKSGQATIILPDQVPGSGEGAWAPFFGRQAFTMTLLPRLAQMKGVTVLWFTGERLPDGKGFVVHIAPQIGEYSGEREQDAAVLNANVEAWIQRWPQQYLWSYNRYKKPSGAPEPVV